MNAPRLCIAALCALALCACPPSASQQPAPQVEVSKKPSSITNGVVDDVPSHMAVVAMKQGGQFACSGTLISPRVVLTAGHCVEGASAGSMTIGFGPDIRSPSMKWVAVSEAKQNPGYTGGNSLANDLGLVRLAGPPPDGIAPIPVLPSSLALAPADVGTTVEFSGFGNTENNTYGLKLKVSDTLDLICETAGGCPWADYGKTPNHTICYDQQPGGPCSGDSGGPAFVTKDGTEYVVGATSYGDTGCVSDGCSTNATSFEAWIQAFIGDVGPTADGQACTASNQCQTGFCVDGVCCNLACASECTACSVAAGATQDGVCGPIEKTCDDGNKCTTDDKCQVGRCSGTAVSCPPPDSCHYYASCNPATGACGEYPKRPDGTPCDDGDECTVGDRCTTGVCGGTGRATCPASGPCLNDAVCENKKCGEYTPKSEGESCDDGDACTSADACRAGACTGGETKVCPPTTCRGWGRCDTKTGDCILGASLADGVGCDDGQVCTRGDHCKAGACVGTLETGACTPADGCHAAGTCQPDGTCNGAALADGTSCEEGDRCTTGDQCRAGVCVAGATKDCTPPDACHLGNTCNPKTGECAWNPGVTGTACDDGDLCTKDDACNGLYCRGAATECAAAPECQRLAGCNPKTGQCDYNWLEDGAACGNGKCASGKCQASGCGCSSGSEPAALLMAIAALGALARRRRA
ncbi:MAG TPA: trypsin-like serine protease [Myxococcales bacterium]